MDFVFFLSYLATFMLGIVATLGAITWIYFHFEKKDKRARAALDEMPPPSVEDRIDHKIPHPV